MMTADTPSYLVPTLRFPEFLDEPGWKLTSIGDFLRESRVRSATDDPARRITVRLHLQGVELREVRGTEVPGSTTHYSRAAGQFIYGKQNIHKGAFGLIPDHLDGFETSQDLPAFDFSPTANAEWFLHSLSRESVYSSFENRMRGTGSKRLSERSFLRLRVALPPLPEQQKIADCLGSLDDLIAAEGWKLEVLRRHKQGLMQQLFPQPGETVPRLRFQEFRDAGEWKEMSIQEMIDKRLIVGHLDGNHGELYPKSEEFTQDKDGIPYVSANDFVNGAVDFSKCKRLPIQRARLFKKGVAKDGDILFAHNATVGPVAKLSTTAEFVILSTTATYFRCNVACLSNDFLKFCLTSPTFVGQCASVMSQSTRNQVPITTQRKLKLYTTSFLEQQRIAACLSTIDALIAAQTQKLDTLRTHKQGLMQQLFPSLEGDD